MKTKNNAQLTLISGACCFIGQVILNYWLTTAFGATVFNQVAIVSITFLALGFGSFFSYKRFFNLSFAHGFLGCFFLGLGIGFPDLALSIGSIFSKLRIVGTFLFLFIPMGLMGILIPRYSRMLNVFYTESSSLNRVYIYFHLLAAVLLALGEFFLFFTLGIKGVLISLGIFFLGLSFYSRKEQGQNPNKSQLKQKVVKDLLPLSILNGVIQVILFKTNAHFFGPFPENFSALIASSLLGLSLAGWLQERVKLKWGTYQRYVSSLLITFLLGLIAFSYLNQYLNREILDSSLIAIKMARFLLIIICYLPLYTLFSMLVPSYTQETEEAPNLTLALNAWGNGLGLLAGFLVLGSFLSTKYLILLSVIIYLLVTKSSALIRVIVCSLTLIVVLIPKKYFHLSYRFFEDPHTFDFYYKEITGVKSLSYLGAQVDILSLGKDKMLVIDGYKSVKLNQDGEFNKSEILLGSLQGYVGEKHNKALVLGVGSGATVAGNANDYKRVIGVEIHPVILKLQDDFKTYNQNLLKKKHVELVLDDGFNYLLSSKEKFDLITNNVPTPQYSVSSQLWTKEFLLLVKDRLTSDGIYSQWIDGSINVEAIRVILKTLQSVFSHCHYGVVTSTYGNLFCFKERPRNYYEKIASISNLMPYRIFPLNEFAALDFGENLNTLSRPYLKKVLNPFLTKAWRDKRDWFMFDLLKINPSEEDRRNKHCMALEDVKLVKNSSLPAFCQK